MARIRLLVIMTMALLALPGWALAGGWALTSFDELPSDLEAGASYDLTYTVLQHGVNPVDVGQSEVRVVDGNGNVTTFVATRLPERGRYQVTVTFPESGLWTWEVTQGDFGTHPMGPITVSPGVAAVATPSPLAWLLPVALAITIALVGLQIVNLSRQRRRPQPIRAD